MKVESKKDKISEEIKIIKNTRLNKNTLSGKKRKMSANFVYKNEEINQ